MKKSLLTRLLSTLLSLLIVLTPICALGEDNPLDPNDPYTFDLFADWNWLTFDTFEGGICQDYMREKTGITINLTKATDEEQLDLMIASNTLPDLVVCSDTRKIQQLSNSDLCWPLQELIDKYVPQWQIPEVEKNINAYFSEDGQYYALKNEFNTAEEIKNASCLGFSIGQFLVRNDLYQAIGAPKVANKDEFISLMRLVREKYPDMQPLVFNPREYTAFGSMTGFDIVRPTDENGNLVLPISDPTYREMLQVINELYRENFITKENFSYTTNEQAYQGFLAGDVFMLASYSGNDEQMFTGKIRNVIPDAEVVLMPLLDNWKYTLPVSGWAALFIPKSCSDPERAIKMLYWAKQKEPSVALTYGYPGIDWEFDENGNIIALERFQKALAEGKKTATYRGMAFPLSADNFITVNNGFYASATDATKVIFDDILKRSDVSNVIDLCYPKANTELSFMYDDLRALQNECFAKICTSETSEEFNQNYDEMMQIAFENGLQEVNEYIGSTYKALCEQMNCQ